MDISKANAYYNRHYGEQECCFAPPCPGPPRRAGRTAQAVPPSTRAFRGNGSRAGWHKPGYARGYRGGFVVGVDWRLVADPPRPRPRAGPGGGRCGRRARTATAGCQTAEQEPRTETEGWKLVSAPDERIIEVYADWNAGVEPVSLGKLAVQGIRGKAVFSFEYAPTWLERADSPPKSSDGLPCCWPPVLRSVAQGPRRVSSFLTTRSG